MTSRILEKIKKLLALGQSDIPAERDAALAKAYAIAAENKIDLALLDMSLVGVVAEEKFEKGEYRMGRYTAKQRFIGYIVSNFFNVSLVKSWKDIVFIGRASDVTFAKWLWGYLDEEFDRRWDYYRRSELSGLDGPCTAAYRNTFFLGLYRGLDAKLRTERDELQNRKFAEVAVAAPVARDVSEVQNTYFLAVQDESKKIEAAKAEFFPSLRQGRAHRAVVVRSHSVLSAGRAIGGSIRISRTLNA